jgi:SPP1 family predicted phage head-tail adaptor
MRAGRLRHQLILQSQVETRDPTGGVTISWETQDTVWGGIEPLSGREYTAIQQTQDEASVRIIIRYRADIDASWRVVNEGLAYSIVSPPINENMRDRQLILMCLEGVKEDTILILFDVNNNPLQFVDETYWESVS